MYPHIVTVSMFILSIDLICNVSKILLNLNYCEMSYVSITKNLVITIVRVTMYDYWYAICK